MSSPDDWAIAYVRQAEADFNTWNRLKEFSSPFPECHTLMFLQMACEKLGKAHLYKGGAVPEDIQTSHAHIRITLPRVIEQPLAWAKLTAGKKAEVNRFAKQLAREIELLSPAVKDGNRRPDNCEYPWEDPGGMIHVPRDWKYTPAERLRSNPGLADRLQKCIYQAIKILLKDHRS